MYRAFHAKSKLRKHNVTKIMRSGISSRRFAVPPAKTLVNALITFFEAFQCSGTFQHPAFPSNGDTLQKAGEEEVNFLLI